MSPGKGGFAWLSGNWYWEFGFFSSDKDFGKNKWELSKRKNKAMVNSMLEEWGKVKLAGDGGRCKELNFLSTLTGSQ